MSQLLHIQDLNISFPSQKGLFQAVQNFNLEVDAGEVVAIVGESGSGKSVSLLSITRLLPQEARIEASQVIYSSQNGPVNLLDCSQDELRKLRSIGISYVFQEPMSALHPLFTCGSQINEALFEHGSWTKADARKKTLSLFEEMQLPDPELVYTSYPHELSGGQRQRVMLALALCNDPELLIADEPTTALDSVLQRAVIELMVSSCRTRSTGLIIISHDIDIVRDFSDRTVVMYRGNIMETGTTKTITSKPEHPYTKALIECRPNFNSRSFNLPTVDALLENKNGAFTAKDFKAQPYPMKQVSEEHAVSGDNVEVVYKGKRLFKALKGISFEVYQGESLGIVGESGSGKSTLAKLLIKLVDLESGQLQFKASWDKLTRKEFARKVQMIFQDPYASLNPNLSVGNMIAEVLNVHKICKPKVQKQYILQLLEEVGLKASDYDKYPHEFSGGQRQRISIARALAVEPEILILDESVSALDVSVQAQILNLLKELQLQRDLTYIFITHDLNVVSYFCDRIMVLKEGEILEINKTKKIVLDADIDYTRSLFGHIEH